MEELILVRTDDNLVLQRFSFIYSIVINAVDIHKKNALHYAVEFGREDLVGLFLLVPSCEPNFPDRDHMTALHLAVKKKNPNIVYQLLADENQQQPDPNAVNMNGQTPLHMAAQTGQIEIVRMILQAELEEQCDPTIVDAQQLTAYQVAQANHQDACARIIQEYQEGWEKLTPRRENTGSINEREINPMFGGQSHRSQNPDDDLSESTSTASSRRSRSINSQSDRTAPSSANANKPGGGSLADLIKSNPLHSNMRPTSASGPTNNHTLSNLIQRNPLQSFDTAGKLLQSLFNINCDSSKEYNKSNLLLFLVLVHRRNATQRDIRQPACRSISRLSMQISSLIVRDPQRTVMIRLVPSLMLHRTFPGLIRVLGHPIHRSNRAKDPQSLRQKEWTIGDNHRRQDQKRVALRILKNREFEHHLLLLHNRQH